MAQKKSVRTEVRGHGLQSEGAAHDSIGRRLRNSSGASGDGRAKCSCGVLSDVVPSGNQRKIWHKQHKAAVVEGLAATTAS